jgi:hypothetical protein
MRALVIDCGSEVCACAAVRPSARITAAALSNVVLTSFMTLLLGHVRAGRSKKNAFIFPTFFVGCAFRPWSHTV